MMRNLLFIRKSPFQIYCANTLFNKGVISEIIIEEGNSIEPEKVNICIQGCPRRLIKGVKLFFRQPSLALHKALRILRHRDYYGNRSYHEKRILQNDFEAINPQLRVLNVDNINSQEAINRVVEFNPRLVFIFGTRLITKDMLNAIKVPALNLHWGWSPDYRGEGIVSALSEGNFHKVGVTLHLLNRNIDAGNILYQQPVTIDKDDNFYSLGLKFAKLGTELFEKASYAYTRLGFLSGSAQETDRGKLYTTEYMKENPQLYTRAWKRLKEYKSLLCK